MGSSVETSSLVALVPSLGEDNHAGNEHKLDATGDTAKVLVQELVVAVPGDSSAQNYTLEVGQATVVRQQQ